MTNIPNTGNILDVSLTSSELVTKHKEFENIMLWHAILAFKGVNIIAAQRGTGKTRLLLALSYCIIYARQSFIGYDINLFGNVLWLNYEIPEEAFKLFVEPLENRFKRIKFHPPKHELITMSFLSHPNVKINDIQYLLSNYTPVLVVIDSYKAFASIYEMSTGTDLSKNLKIYEVYQILRKWSESYNTTFVFITHTNKGHGADISADNIFGPGALLDFADHISIMQFAKGETNHRVFHPSKVRYCKPNDVYSNLICLESYENDEFWFEVVETEIDPENYIQGQRTIQKRTEADKTELKEKAIKLKKSGMSYADIAKYLLDSPKKKSTIYNWLNDKK